MCAALSPDTAVICQLESQMVVVMMMTGALSVWHVIETRTRLSRGERDDLQPPPTTITLGAIVERSF